jgi:hypothetical protein
MMTTLTNQCRKSPPTTRKRLLLAWDISPHAAAAAGMCEAPAPMRLEIEAPWPGSRGCLCARIVGERGRLRDGPQSTSEIQWIADERRGLLHLEAPGLLRATLRLIDDQVQVLYARTALLEELGVGGGRYDLDVRDVEST